MTISEAVKKRVIELLQEKNITQYSLEKKATISHYTLKAILKDKTKSVDLKTIFALANGFDMSISDFFNSSVFDYQENNIEF